MTNNLHTLSDAIAALKEGKSIKRQCWASSVLTYVPESNDCCEHIRVKLYTGKYTSWTPTQDDILGNDWLILD